MKKILFFIGNRAEEGLLEPVFCEIDKHKIDWHVCDVGIKKNVEEHLDRVYRNAWNELEAFKPDIVSCSFDRPEMIPCALAAFYQNIPIFQVHAGDSGEGTHDETVRYLLSQLATLKFCVDKHSEFNLYKKGITDNVFVSGSTAFDLFEEVNINELKDKYNIEDEYDLIVLHPNTLSREKTIEDANEVICLLDKATIILYPNNDLYRDEIMNIYTNYRKNNTRAIDDTFMKGFETRNEYLTILKYANRVIGNSSSFVYELPFFDKEEIHIGERNKDRRKIKATTGGSKFIVNKIMEFLKNDL